MWGLAYGSGKKSTGPRCLIADSKLYFAGNAASLSAINFITRVPSTIKKEHESVATAVSENVWSRVDDDYQLREFPIFHFGFPQRWIVVQSEVIWFGTLSTLRKLGLEVEMNPGKLSVPVNERSNFDVLLLVGGGNLVKYYNHMHDIIEHENANFARVVVLPSTVRGNEKLLNSMGCNVTLFCRDIASYSHCKREARGVGNLFLAHDLAFASDIASLGLDLTIKRRDLFAFRTDVEVNAKRKDIPLPKGNVDISRLGSIDPNNSIHDNMKTVRKFLAPIAACEIAWTDRLHVAIGGIPSWEKSPSL